MSSLPKRRTTQPRGKRWRRLRSSIAAKMAELQKTIDLRSTGHGDEAVAEVDSDRGKDLMAAIRQAIADMRSEETALLARRSTRAAWLEGMGQAVLLASLILVIVFGALALVDARRRVVALQQSNTRLRTEAAERLAAENQVRQLQKMEAVGQLMGGIAHDFNNMLAIVIGSLELAHRRLAGTEHPAVLKCIDNAIEGANRAATLTARLLAFSRQQPLEPRVIDVNKLVGGMSELLQRSIGEAIHIETVLAGGLWKVLVDPAQLENAIVNLAVNARDAMPDGGKLTIETHNAELDERYAAAHSEVVAGQYVVDLGDGQRRRDEPRGDGARLRIPSIRPKTQARAPVWVSARCSVSSSNPVGISSSTRKSDTARPSRFICRASWAKARFRRRTRARRRCRREPRTRSFWS